jgi:8-oxo-dGTP pyrophosphatase MutT (NUDIX family)
MAHYIHENGLKLRQKVRAVIASPQGEILLIRPHGYSTGEWTLAGGGVEAGESPVEAMRRELAEELGIGCEDPVELPVTNRFIYSDSHKRARKLDHDGQDAVMFFVSLSREAGLVLQTEELAEARWFANGEAAAAFPVRAQREIFEKCMAAAGGQLSRSVA